MASPTWAARASFRPLSLTETDDSLQSGDPIRCSAADLGHRSTGADEAWIADSVLQLLVPDCAPHRVREGVVGCARPQHGLEVPLPAREEARPQLPVGGDPDPVAGGAERLRDGVDEADLARSVGEAVAP